MNADSPNPYSRFCCARRGELRASAPRDARAVGSELSRNFSERGRKVFIHDWDSVRVVIDVNHRHVISTL